MVNNDTKDNWKKIRTWWKKRSDDQFTIVTGKREQFIRILQSRYGYDKEEAMSELDKHYSKARLF
jgi:uncharacterized protein YjbJ (UPF0337 family)